MKWGLMEYYNGEFDDINSIDLRHNDVSGGNCSKDDIDIILNYPSAEKIIMSGLKQEVFEYFIDNYAQQFKVIYFWKCPHVSDLSKLSKLVKVEYLLWFWNQRASTLWNMESNIKLKGICIEDFTKVRTLDQLASSKSLEQLIFSDKVWVTSSLNSLEPLKKCLSLKYVYFTLKKLDDGNITHLAEIQKLEEIYFNHNLFTTEQLAWLRAKLPNVKSKVLEPYYTTKPLEWKTSKGIKIKDTQICGKRKPFLDSNLDKNRIDKYVEAFSNLVATYRHQED